MHVLMCIMPKDFCQNGPKWSKMAKMGKNGPKWAKMGKNGQKWA
jgi:hypothetical protein